VKATTPGRVADFQHSINGEGDRRQVKCFDDQPESLRQDSNLRSATTIAPHPKTDHEVTPIYGTSPVDWFRRKHQRRLAREVFRSVSWLKKRRQVKFGTRGQRSGLTAAPKQHWVMNRAS
jgi:hypothetical protein